MIQQAPQLTHAANQSGKAKKQWAEFSCPDQKIGNGSLCHIFHHGFLRTIPIKNVIVTAYKLTDSAKLIQKIHTVKVSLLEKNSQLEIKLEKTSRSISITSSGSTVVLLEEKNISTFDSAETWLAQVMPRSHLEK